MKKSFTKIVDTITLHNIDIYLERDNDGYYSLSTDGHTDLSKIVKLLRALQTEDDKELELFAKQREAKFSNGKH